MPWHTLELTAAELLDTCASQDLAGLIYERARHLPAQCGWPQAVYDALADQTHAEAARELLRAREIRTVLDVLAAEGIHPILLKGTPLAYSLYDTPHLRPRLDTDLLVRRTEVDTVRHVLSRLHYFAPPYCDGELLFCQVELAKEDEFGVDHTFDCHWKISTQSMFADLLPYDELAAEAVAVPALGPHARTASLVHTLLLACIHPVMHHRNEERLIWLYDIHLLASRLPGAEFDRFIDLAIAKRVAAVCAHELALAQARFRTRIADDVTTKLTAGRNHEPSAEYLQPERRWHDELVSNMRGNACWTDRLELLREVLFPASSYILRAYGVTPGSLAARMLPALYLHRIVFGGWKVLRGRK